MKLLPLNGVKVNGNNGVESGAEVFLPYEHGVSDESGLLEYIDAGQTPPILLDVLSAKFPLRVNLDEYGQEVDILVRDLRFLSKEKKTNLNPHSSEFDSLTRQVSLRPNNMTIQKIVRQKVMALNQSNRTKSHLQHQQQLYNQQQQLASTSGGNQLSSTEYSTGSQTEVINGHASIEEVTCHSPVKKSKKKDVAGSSSANTKKQKDLDSYQSLVEEETEAEAIESQVILNSAPPLCLDPSPVVHLVENKLYHASRLVSSSRPIQQLSRQIILNERRILQKRKKILARRTSTSTVPAISSSSGLSTSDVGLPSHQTSSTVGDEPDDEERMFVNSNPFLKLSVFLSKKPNRLSNPLVKAAGSDNKFPSISQSVLQDPYPLPNEGSNNLDMEAISQEIARLSGKLRNQTAQLSKSDNSLVKLEEYLIEFETPGSHLTGGQVNSNLLRDPSRPPPPPVSGGITCVSIFQKPLDDLFYGQLYVDRVQPGQVIQSSESLPRSSSSSKSCIFPLGSRDGAKRYLEQFKEILTENGRKTVRISRSSSSNSSSHTSSVVQQQQVQPPHTQPQQQVMGRSQQSAPAPTQIIPQNTNVQHLQPQIIHHPSISSTPTPPPSSQSTTTTPNIQVIPHQTAKVILPSTGNITLQPHQQAHIIRQPLQQQHLQTSNQHQLQQLQMTHSTLAQTSVQHHRQPTIQPQQITVAAPPQQTTSQQTSLSNPGHQTVQMQSQTPMICTMLSGNTLQAVLTSQPTESLAQQAQQHPTLLQAIQPGHSVTVNHQQQQRIGDGSTQPTVQLTQINPSQLRTIQGTQSWLVIPPTTGTSGQATLAPQQNAVGVTPVGVSVPQGSFRPVHVILWPQQQAPAASAQINAATGQPTGPGHHQIVATSAPTIIGNINLAVSGQSAAPATVTVNAAGQILQTSSTQHHPQQPPQPIPTSQNHT